MMSKRFTQVKNFTSAVAHKNATGGFDSHIDHLKIMCMELK
jgi:hypothetical protein